MRRDTLELKTGRNFKPSDATSETDQVRRILFDLTRMISVEEIQRLKSQVIAGKNVNLRIATENDAEFILKLRLNPLLNEYIGHTDPSVDKQRAWIRGAFDRPNDFHFIIEGKDSQPHGTIAVYNIDFETGVAEWGRWVIKPGSPVFFPIESTILAFYFAFRKLHLKKLVGGANNKNKKVVSFHKIYAAVSSVDENHTWFYVEIFNFISILKTFRSFHCIQPGES